MAEEKVGDEEMGEGEIDKRERERERERESFVPNSWFQMSDGSLSPSESCVPDRVL